MSAQQASYSQRVGGWDGRWALQHMHSGQWPPQGQQMADRDLVCLPFCWAGPTAPRKGWEACIPLAALMGSFPLLQMFSEDIGWEEFV